MSLFNNAIIGASGQGGYRISRSVRIRQSASAYFNRTFATPTSNQKMTLSCWVKIGSTSQTAGQLTLLNGGNGTQVNASNSFIQLRSDGTALKLQILCNGGGAATVGGYRTFAPYFRDNSAWYHIILAADTTQATAANRYRAYVNGVEITSYTGVDPNQNVSITWLNTAVEHLIGKNNEGGGPVYSDTYITEMYWIDGQQLTPSSFGQINSQTGVWQPIKYTGTYGTNGFYLNFSDNSGITATTIGKDYSGNGNNWTPNNISVTAGVTYDSMIDVPTLYADGGNGRGNYAVLNPLQLPTAASTVLSNANLLLTCNSGTSFNSFANGTMYPTSGKYYAEFYINTVGETYVGISRFTDASTPNSWNSQSTYYNRGGVIQKDNATIFSVATYTTGDTIGVAYDVDNATCAFYKNNTLVGTVTGVTAGSYTFSIAGYLSAAISFNTGQRPFTYTPPTGFVALNTQNLPTPTISNGATVMAATTYTGTGATQTINNAVNGVSFQPDFVWVKGRSGATDHALYDAVRGVQLQIESNTITAETTETTGLTAFGSTGFTIGALAQMNTNAATYVGWQWNAGGSTVTNTSGSISSQVRANATAGFSVVTYTGNGSTGTVGHGLGVTPNMVIVKNRGAATDWAVWTPDIYLSQGTYLLYLNTTAAKTATSAWNNSNFASTYFPVGSSSLTNSNATNYVAFCWAAVKGYSAFGSYTGNGSTDGPFVYLGFRPRFVMIKRTDVANAWMMYDTARNTDNVVNKYLFANASDAENTGSGSSDLVDFLSNGFKLRCTTLAENASGGTYIYACFAENPFKLSLAR